MEDEEEVGETSCHTSSHTSLQTSSQTSLISQRIVSVDFYSHPPNYLFDQVKNDFNKTESHWVPVIRIFGATKEGQKSCAHIHGVFPYLYIQQSSFLIDKQELAQRLDDALNRNTVAATTTSVKSHKHTANLKHVVQIVPVKGRSFYGYQSNDEVFLKIYFYTPFALTKASQLLANGSIMDRKMQPFESHISYIQQFFIDYNLFGMNLIHYSKALFRRNESQTEFIRSVGPDKPRPHWSYNEMGEHLFLPESVKRMTTCDLEFDVLADDILNRLEKRARNSNPGIVAIWKDEMERRKLNGIVNWAEIPIPVSQDRIYCGDIFEAELCHRKTLLEKLKPFNYLSSRSNVGLTAKPVLPNDLLPASSQSYSQSSQLFLPQPESHVSFSAKERTLSQENNNEEDEDIINFLEQLAHECQQGESGYEDHSILKSEEFEDIHCTDDSQKVASSLNLRKKKLDTPVIKVEQENKDLDGEPDELKKDITEVELEDEIWSASFLSQTFDDIEILENPPIETKSGSARTDPVCLSSRKTKEERNQWNNDVLEKFMVDIMYGQYEPIDLDVDGVDTCNNDGDGNEKGEITTSSNICELKSNVPPTKKPKLTLAQKLFPNAILRPEHFLYSKDTDSPSSSQDSVHSQQPPTTAPKLPDHSQTKNISVSTSNQDITIHANLDSHHPNQQLLNKFHSRNQSIAIRQQPGCDKEIQVQLESFSAPKQDFECQSYPVYSYTEVQTEKMLPDGISTSTNTDPVITASSGSQTDSTTMDVVRTCGCRCNCGLQYMAALKASWEMAEKNKDRGVQTDDQLLLHPHSDSPLLSLTPKRLRLDDSSNDNSGSSRRSHQNDSSSSSVSLSKSLRKKLYKQASPGEQAHRPELGGGLSIQFADLSPQQQRSTVGTSNSSVHLSQSKTGGSGSSRGRNQHKNADDFILSPKSSKSRRPNWDTLRLSHPSKFSPQFDAVTKLLKRKASVSASNSAEKKAQGQNQSPSPKKSKQHNQNRNSTSPRHPTITVPILPISPRFLDMSITSVYEYEAPDTSEQKFLRFQAAKRGLRLFEYKHQQMLGMQRESAQRRKERRELRDSKIETKFAVRETIKPFKRTPQESFIASLVAQNERLALPPLSDYYAECCEGECDLDQFTSARKKFPVKKQDSVKQLPNVCHFQGGNLSDEDNENENSDNEKELNNSQNIPSQVTNERSDKIIVLPETPMAKRILSGSGSISSSTADNDESPRSILKSSSGSQVGKNKKRQYQQHLRRRSIKWGVQTPEKEPKRSIRKSQDETHSNRSLYSADKSELDGPSPLNPFNAFLDVSNLQTAKALHLHQYVTTMCVEVFCAKKARLPDDTEESSKPNEPNEIDSEQSKTESNYADNDDTKVPDPLKDEIIAIFYTIHQDSPHVDGCVIGMLAVDPDCCENESIFKDYFLAWPKLTCSYFVDEISMLREFLALIRRNDPDILVGYEIRYMSWGYIIDRGVALGLNMIQALSRLLPRENKKQFGNNNMDPSVIEWNESISGRIVLNLWRLLRHEMTVQSYTFESAMFNIMHEKVGLVSLLNLNKFWEDDLNRYRTVNFYCHRVQGVMDIIDKLDLINRTSELARLFGIQFFEVFSRGSQFRVESMMLRLTKSDSLIPASPTVSQRAGMRAPVELPLIMEPHSKYYTDPVAVLDFQSLYPSIIIAYNYDFSTCLGRVEHLGREDRFDFGCLDLIISPLELSRYMSKNEIHISPTGVAFLKSSVRRGILPEMLEQILETRLMVKRSMKAWSGSENKTLHKVLDSRQLGLKLIANVTYGYTSANFSGRMPCVEIADSVVSKGRETLERAIKLVEENEERWGAKVIYGDTDSMFIHFPNYSREKAFELAQEIADEVTRMNPKPVKLKLEKIYQPCILQTKKRYVGFSYENIKQKEPKYDAKGIETVRRDGCPAVAKILEKSLRILFTTNDILKLRQYLEAQFQKIFLGNVNLSDFTFAREYRGWSGYKPGAVVPALTIAERLRNNDKRSEPQPQERVPYIVIFGEPGRPLIHHIRTPREFLEHEGLRINSVYYIERALLPPLNRCFSLAGIDVQKWYSEIPRRNLRVLPHENRLQQGKRIMDYFIVSMNCVGCDAKSETVLCSKCRVNSSIFLKLIGEADALTRKMQDVAQTCKYCALGVCMSLDCTTWQKLLRYDRVQQNKAELVHRALSYFPHWQD